MQPMSCWQQPSRYKRVLTRGARAWTPARHRCSSRPSIAEQFSCSTNGVVSASLMVITRTLPRSISPRQNSGTSRKQVRCPEVRPALRQHVKPPLRRLRGARLARKIDRWNRQVAFRRDHLASHFPQVQLVEPRGSAGSIHAKVVTRKRAELISDRDQEKRGHGTRESTAREHPFNACDREQHAERQQHDLSRETAPGASGRVSTTGSGENRKPNSNTHRRLDAGELQTALTPNGTNTPNATAKTPNCVVAHFQSAPPENSRSDGLKCCQ